MAKKSAAFSNAFCPQALFLYGTYKENGDPNFGLFCWASYCWDAEYKFMCCIGEPKLTRDRIRATGIFSASLEKEKLLAAADFIGNNPGYKTDKSGVLESVKGAVLDVPAPVDSPWTFELEVDKTVELAEGSEIYVCKIRNMLADERLLDENTPIEERIGLAAPVVAFSPAYYPIAPKRLGNWGDWASGKGEGKGIEKGEGEGEGK